MFGQLAMALRTGPWLLWATAAITLLTSSCQSRFKPTYPVTGHVLYEGKPPVGAKVFFKSLDFPDDPIAKPMGEVNDNGDFTLTTYKVGDGAPAGAYSVTFIWLPRGFRGDVDKGNKLPRRYRNPETSGFRVQVERANNTFPTFELQK